MPTIVLLGATGYVGQAFAHELRRRQLPFAALTRKELDYTRFETLLGYLRAQRPSFLINAAGYTGSPNVDACETARADTLSGNTLFPQTVAQACATAEIPWGHVSSGCIFAGAKVITGTETTVHKDLTLPDLQEIVYREPHRIRGFTESDEPNFSFRAPPCSFYSGTKALAEEAIAGVGRSYLWRLRIPFDEWDNPRNYLTKLQRYDRVYDNVNSLSHRRYFVQACVELWERQAPFGIYNVTNPGFVTSRHVIELIQHVLKPNRRFQFWEDDAEFYRLGAKTPRSNCVLDVSKLLEAGVKLPPVEQALEEALSQWKTQ